MTAKNCHLSISHCGSNSVGAMTLLLVLGITLSMTSRLVADLKTWTGAHPSSHHWSLASNWDPSGAPRNGDDLIFPDPDIALKEVNTNNIANLRLRSITFQGNNALYHLWGNGITLSNALNAGHTIGINTVQLDFIALGAGLELRSTSVLILNSDVALNGFPLTLNTPVAAGDLIFVNGVISGTGGLIKDGAGIAQLGGALPNTFVGLTTVRAGQLNLGKPNGVQSIPDSLVVGDGIGVGDKVVWVRHNQLGSPGNVVVRTGATLDLNGSQETIGSLELTGGRVETGVGLLGLGGDITANASSLTSEINGRLDLNGMRMVRVFSGSAAPCDLEINAVVTDGGLTKRGPGTLCVNGDNDFSGQVRVEDGELRMGRDLALGTASGGTIVLDGASLYVGTGANNVDEPLTLAGAGMGGTNGALKYLGSVNWRGNITMASASLVVSDSDLSALDIQGVISGTGRLTKGGGGRLRLSGPNPNTFNGDLQASEGTLELAKTSGLAVPRNLIAGWADVLLSSTAATVRSFHDAQISGSITLNRGSLYDLNGHSDGIVNLVLVDGADVTLGDGQLTLSGSIDAARGQLSSGDASNIGPSAGRILFSGAPAEHVISVEEGVRAFPDVADLTIDARVIGSPGIQKMGGGDLMLTANNDYDGRTIVNEGDLWISNPLALGRIANGTEVNGTAALGIWGDLAAFEPLILNPSGSETARALLNIDGTNTWSGAIKLSGTARVDVQFGTALRVYGAVSGPGGITKDGLGRLEYRGSNENTYSGTTTVNSGKLVVARTGGPSKALKGGLVIGDGVGGVDADIVETDGNEPQMGNLVRVQVQSSGLLRIGTTVGELIGPLLGNGRVVIDAPRLGVTSTSGAVFEGVISGSGALDKHGAGKLGLWGNNTYTGLTTVREGQLEVNGLQVQSHVNVIGGAALEGSGSVGDVDVFGGGTLSPGSAIGTLNTRDVRLRAGSTLLLQITGGPENPVFDVLNVLGGTVMNEGATLQVDTVGNAAPVEGAIFDIIQNSGIDPVQGTFAGLPNAAIVQANFGLRFRVNYNGFGQNDVRLTLVDVPLRTVSSNVTGGNLDSALDLNECIGLTISLFNGADWALANVKTELKTSTPGVLITQSESGYPDILPGSRQPNWIPFQLSTLPGFQCGTNVQLHLEVKTPTNGTFTLPLVIRSGSPGSPLRFDRSVAEAIPDANTLASSLNVSGFAGHLAKVAVSLHVAHNQLDNLDMVLVAPDGTQVVLSSDNGGTANDYGTGCADSERTVFDPLSSRLISSGLASAPFVGTFRPEGNLENWRGRWQTEVNGTWTLRVTDDAPGGLGSLNCWSLFLYPAECVDGGGACESCNGPFLAEIQDTDPAMTQRLGVGGLPTFCSTIKACPGLGATIGTFHYNVHRFTNGLNPACVSVTSTPGADVPLQSVAYLNAFDPSNPCLNYLADAGIPSVQPHTYAFKVLPGQVFEVVVQSSVSGLGTRYRLNVDGFECPPPALNIGKTADPHRVQLSWSTAYPQYRLEGAIEAWAPLWSEVGPSPAVIGGKFSVTNNATLGYRFYRLRSL
jgi:autotransporter-associated beta strand protein